MRFNILVGYALRIPSFYTTWDNSLLSCMSTLFDELLTDAVVKSTSAVPSYSYSHSNYYHLNCAVSYLRTYLHIHRVFKLVMTITLFYCFRIKSCRLTYTSSLQKLSTSDEKDLVWHCYDLGDILKFEPTSVQLECVTLTALTLECYFSRISDRGGF